MKKQFLEVGEVVAIHGLRGDLRLYPWCDPGDIERSARMYLDENGEQEYKVSYAKPHKNVYLVKLRGIDNPEDARKFIGKVLYMNRNDIPMKAGDYFIQDIIGLKVVDAENITPPVKSIRDEKIKRPESKLERFYRLENLLKQEGLI